MFINNYILKNESTGQLTIFWKLKRYVNLSKENEHFKYLYDNVDKFAIREVNNDKFLLLEYGKVRFLVKFYRNSFYDIFKLYLPNDVDTINDISITDYFRYINEEEDVINITRRILKINGQLYDIEFDYTKYKNDYNNFDIIAKPTRSDRSPIYHDKPITERKRKVVIRNWEDEEDEDIFELVIRVLKLDRNKYDIIDISKPKSSGYISKPSNGN